MEMNEARQQNQINSPKNIKTLADLKAFVFRNHELDRVGKKAISVYLEFAYAIGYIEGMSRAKSIFDDVMGNKEDNDKE